MIFNSVTYLVFLVITVCLFWVLPNRLRLWMIFLASLTFYGFWRPEFLLVMIASAGTDFLVAQRIEANDALSARRRWLIVSLFVNLGLLFYFKYLFFAVDNTIAVLRFLGIAELRSPVIDIILPLGISFYTFQTISYTVDVYRKFIPAERDFVLYGCFVTYFPQLVAGPILRGRELLYQLETRSSFRLDSFVSGLRRILFGLFLKVVLADNIAPFVDAGFEQQVSALSALDVMTLAFLFGFQIYFDFSAYSHIAIGSARLMGISFPENFNFPYMASSPREFWRRWHISLSSWIRDYLYLPLLGVKVQDRSVGGLAAATQDFGRAMRHPMLVLFLTWAIMGLWHGANWTFVIWGLYHATLIAIYRGIEGSAAKLPSYIRGPSDFSVGLYWCQRQQGNLSLADPTRKGRANPCSPGAPLARQGLARKVAGFVGQNSARRDPHESRMNHIRKWGGWAITMPIMMIAWIPFRSKTVDATFGMFSKLVSPREWLYLGMRENTYLVAAMVLAAMILGYLFHERAGRWFGKRQLAGFIAETVLLGVVVALVFVFLRPISQFIYFQF